jgi:uncharacterized protein (DUF433 family)
MDDQPEIQIRVTPRAQAALDELRAMIAAHFPQATFATFKGYEPAGIYLRATVDVDDIDEVFAVVRDRLLDIQIEERIPVYVTFARPIERTLAELRERQTRAIQAPLPNRIVQDAAIRWGQPVIAGAEVPVELVLASLARGLDVDHVLADHPGLTKDDVRACLTYAQSLVARVPRQEEAAVPASR